MPSASRRPAAQRCVAVLLAATLAAAGPAGAAVFIAFGDSITEGIGDDPARTEKGYPPRLQVLLRARNLEATVQNHGREGETTAEGVSRIDQVLAGRAADSLLLLEGTNDISQRVSNETIAFNLDQIARKAAQRGLETIHATVIPRRPAAGTLDGDNRIAAGLAAEVRELAWDAERALGDAFEVFTTTPNVYADYYPADDRFHPNARGYDLLAEIFFNAILDIDEVAPVTGRVTPADQSDGVPASTAVALEVYDFGAGINFSRTTLRVNGGPVQAVLLGDNQKLEMRYQSATPLVGVVAVELESEDLATPANAVRREVTRFIIAGTSFLGGDTDRSGRVDGSDLVYLALAFGARRGESRYRSAADFNSDDVVDGQDLAVLAANFGRSSF